MRIRVLFFAVVRERLRSDGEEIELPAGTTVGRMVDALALRHDALVGLRRHLQIARNGQVVPLDTVLTDGDEVALIPPVSGGSGEPAGPAALAEVREEPILLDEVARAVAHESAGAIVTFTGMVRRQSHGHTVVRLEYEAYAKMANAKLQEITVTLAARHGARVAILHRVGKLVVGETAVVIAASSPHRAEAFAACRDAIEWLKREVPIWKKEIGETGEEWIGLGP